MAAAAMERFGLGLDAALDMPKGGLAMLLRQPRGLRFGGLTTGDMLTMESTPVPAADP